MYHNRKQLQILALSAIVLSMAYSNCGVVSPSHTNSGASGASSAQQARCEPALKEAFASTYRPLLASPSTCLQCHTEGGTSPFKFASSDFNTAFSDFMRVGPDAVDRNAISPSHGQGGYTGPQNEPAFASARQAFEPSFNDYLSCLGSSGSTDALSLAEKNVQDLYFDSAINSNPITLTWDLSSSDVSPAFVRVPAYFTMRVKVLYETRGTSQVPVGYSFSNPSVQMNSGEQELEVEGIIVRVNGVQIPGGEAFLSARAIARKVQIVPIYNGQINVPMPTVSTADKISVSFGYYNLRQRTDTPVIPPTPTLTVTNPFNNGAQAVNITVSAPTAIRYCLSASPNPPTSTAAPCSSLISTPTGNGWLTSAPTSFQLPTANQGDFYFYLWIANSDLKISPTAAIGRVTIDSVAPSPPTLTSVTISGSPIADLNGLSNSNESVTWCVLESNRRDQVEVNNPGCTFSATKPSFVALKGDGVRYVAVFVRDSARNLARSATHSVTNTAGTITFDKLKSTDPVQGLFQSRCFSCHNTGATNVANWNATSYSDSYNKRAGISSRVSLTPPAAHSSANVTLTEKERALINLWVSQPAEN